MRSRYDGRDRFDVYWWWCTGDGLDSGPDASLALKWWLQAAELGHIHALYQAAASYEAGRGVSADPARAAELFLGGSVQLTRSPRVAGLSRNAMWCDEQRLLKVVSFQRGRP